ncbi:MAG: ATP-binding cassette domain-containing protein [Treponema sp.]|nr:ATP-binding cassette domain-containing protein [Treponema sp.]
MLLLSKILLKMAKGLWLWIIAILGLKILALAGIALFSQTLSGFLGSMAEGPLSPDLLSAATGQAAGQALLGALMVLGGELLIGEAEYRCTARARLSLRKRIFSKILLLDVGSIEKIGMSQAVAAAVDGIESMQIYYSRYLPGLFYCLVSPVYLFFRLRDSSFGAAVFLLVVSIFLFPANNLFKKIVKGSKTVLVWDSFRELTGYYLESLRGLSTLKLFNQDERREKNLRDRAGNFNRHLMGMIHSNFVSFLFSDGIIYLSVFLSVVFVCTQLSRGAAALGDAVMVLMLGYGFFASVRQLMFSTHQALTGIAAAEALSGILDIDTARPRIGLNGGSAAADTFAGIRLEGVSYTYPGRDSGVRDLTMDIPRGTVCALAGPSGSGKTTLASLLLRFFDPVEGRIVIEGVPYAAQSPEELREKIALVPQQVGIFSGTIAENLRIACPGASDGELREVLDLVRLGDWLPPEGLETQVGDAGDKLSGGQKQKLGIARVLLRKAPYIVFDEATSGVDADSERDIWACIAELSLSRTLIIISHRLSTIRNADTIWVLAGGRIVESGNHRELLGNRNVYYRLVQEQAVLEGRDALETGPVKAEVL